MNKNIILYQNAFRLGIPFALFGALIMLIKSSIFDGNNTLTLAITADLLITIPFIYFLLIRKSDIPKTTIVPVMIIGVLIGSNFIPQEQQNYLKLFKQWFLPLVEITVLSFVVFKVRKIFKNSNEGIPDFYEALKNACQEILPQKLILPFATEVAVFYYGLINWRKKTLSETEFSYHQNSGTPALFIAFIMVIGVETIALHFLLDRWSTTAAWILTGLSLYTALQFFGFFKALSQRPFSVEKDQLILKYSIMNETIIDYDNILNVTLSQQELEKDQLTQTLSPLGALENHNVIIQLKEENTLIGLYGLRKKYKTLALYVDKPAEFISFLQKAIENSKG